MPPFCLPLGGVIMCEYVIEKAKPEDAEKLLEYLRVIGGESDNLTFGSEGVPFSVEAEKTFIQSRLDSQTDVLYLVKCGDHIIGNGSINSLSGRMAHRAELGISVLKAYWGKGIGSMLMENLISFAKEGLFEILSLDVRTDNKRAIRLYEKYGFKRIATYPGYMKINGELIDFDLMYLPLR